jgi:hypothetical protein
MPKKTAARKDNSYPVATCPNYPGVDIPLQSDEECQARGISKPTVSLLSHLTPEECLKRLEPLIALPAEPVLRELLSEARQNPESLDASSP